MDDDPEKKKAKSEAKTGKENIRPEFLATTDKLREAEEKAAEKRTVNEENLEEDSRDGGFYRPESGSSNGSRSSRRNLFSGLGKATGDKKKSRLKIGKKSTATIVLFLIIILVVVVIAIGSPLFMIGHIDFNLMQSLGYSDTVAILEEQGEYVTAEMLAEGEFPKGYSDDLANNGMTVGQVTAKGDFIQTNVYIADVESLGEVASLGNYQVNVKDGELAILYNDRVIQASEFVAAVESDPRMYADYSEAIDISARYYYSNDVNKVYQDMGLSRSSFIGWESTGDSEKDKESYYEILYKVLDDGDFAATVSGIDEEVTKNEDGEINSDLFFQKTVSGSVTDDLIDEVRRPNSTEATNRAGQLLNSAISSSEPYRAAKAFLAIEEPLQRARAGDNGPVNEVMNSLYEKTAVSYVDVNTGQTVTEEKSILETNNFVAAISGGSFSKAEANNFSRDRIAMTTGTGSSSAIKNTIVSSTGDSNSGSVTGLRSWAKPNTNSLKKPSVSSTIDIAVSTSNSETFQSVIGGNRAIEGGSFLSNKINQRVLGAAPSDSRTIAEYHKEVEKVFARKAEAERATLSPFDISSPNTFLGNIVSKFANAVIQNSSSSKASIISTVSEVANSSMKELVGGAIAEGEDVSYTTLSGDNCTTVYSAAKVEGDLYCTAHNTITTKYMSWTKSDWASIANSSELNEYRKNGMARESTIGVKDAEVCKNNNSESGSFITKLINGIAGIFGVYNVCTGVDPDVATGAKYTLSYDNGGNYGNIEKYSGYTLHDVVYSILSEKQSETSRFFEEYYVENPQDNSAAGRIARISGMTKEEAEVALNYASYLDFIAKYDASDRYAFGGFKIETEKSLFFEQDEKIKETLYGVWSKRSEYRDERNRSYAV